MNRVIVIRKYQTALPQFDDSMDESTGWQGWKPVQQASAQHPQHATQYLQGDYPEEFWTFAGKEASPHHGAAQHRTDDTGTYLSVGIRGDAPGGEKMKVGRKHMREDMPDKRQIVVSRKSAKDVPRYQREKKRLEEKKARAKSKKSRRRPLPRGVGVFKAPLADAPLQPGQARVDERFTLPGLTDFVNVPSGQAFASSDRQARGIATPMRGFQQMMAMHTGEGYGPHWALPGFEHIANRGEGKGRKYLEEMSRELKEKDDMPIRIYAAQPHTLPFWDKMFGEGVVDSVHHSHDPMIHRPPELHFPGHPNYERHKDVPKPNWLLDKLKEKSQLKKHAESPEAKKHKKEYDTKYESTPKRKKYRAELTQERRKRGIAGKGGKDMSHTARGTIVPEDRHANRARHFKERGTLKKNLNRWFKEKWVDVSRTGKDGKHPPCGRSKAKKGSKGYPKCRPSVKVSSKTPKTSGSMSSGQKRAATKRKRSKKQGVGGKPTIVKEQKKLFQPGVRQTNLFNNQTALVPTDFGAEQKAREEAQRLAQEKEARRQAQMVKVRELKLKPLDKFGMLKMQMLNAQMILKGECPTPHKGAYRSMEEAQEVAKYQSRQAGRPISAYRCVSMGGKGCGMFHLTSG